MIPLPESQTMLVLDSMTMEQLEGVDAPVTPEAGVPTSRYVAPNIDLPIRFIGGDLALNEMDSTADYKTKAEVVIRYRPNDRPDLPEFGSPSLLGQRVPLDTSEIQRALTEWVPECNYRISESGNLYDPADRRLQIEVDEPSVST